MRKTIFLWLISALLPLLSGCSQTQEPTSCQAILFDTIIRIQIYDFQEADALLQECLEQCQYYEHLFSRTIEGSDIYRINHAKGEPTEVSDETVELLSIALDYCKRSDGIFDITLATISDLWDFQNNSGTLPEQQALDEALSHVGYENVLLFDNMVQLTDPETQIDLGGIAKGYIADQLKQFLIDQGVEHALIDLGGNILPIGGKPDGSAFRIAIQKPFDAQGSAITSVETKNCSVVSSGNYQRYFEKDGTIYHHILNPNTGYPCENELLSVTILTDSSVDADALSTTCFALGLEKGTAWIQSLEDTEAIFITKDYEIMDTRQEKESPK